ncbi:lysoplasmalogenase family protein [Aestuariimicrobium soli]|uniref:lysoplasmalogenase family protein n=1 Tax=Aestuariimicrobium soli TaxID=2035834 RepID=UPI003EC0B1C7
MTGARIAIVAFVLATLTNLISLAAGAHLVSEWSQNLMIPCLVVALLLSPTTPDAPLPRLRRGTLAGLLLSWLGDLLPGFVPDDLAFLVMVGAFLCGHLAFCWAFWPLRRASLLGRPGALPSLAAYVVAYVVLMAAVWSGAGALRVPILVYGLVLTLMAVLATGVHRLATLGGILFMVSDSLIALQAFRGWHGAAVPVAIMGTYGAACLLILLAVLRRLRRP